MELVGLKGESVRLVPLDRTLHLDNALRWLNDPEISACLEQNLGVTRRQEEEFFERMEARRETDFVWAILSEENRHIGFIGLHAVQWRHRSAAGGLVIGERNTWGRGYATDAVRVRTRFAFDVAGLHRLEGHTINPAMRRVYEKCGYRHEGIARQKYWRGGRWVDADFMPSWTRTTSPRSVLHREDRGFLQWRKKKEDISSLRPLRLCVKPLRVLAHRREDPMVPLAPVAAEHVLSWEDETDLRVVALHHALIRRRPGLWGDHPCRPGSVLLLREGGGAVGGVRGRPSRAGRRLARREGGDLRPAGTGRLGAGRPRRGRSARAGPHRDALPRPAHRSPPGPSPDRRASADVRDAAAFARRRPAGP
jgi:RimJ/RimL family protein N-acetyltransferase